MQAQEKRDPVGGKTPQAWVEHLKWLGIKVEGPKKKEEASR
ncbi:MAG: hypothetical protein PWP65_361 [Clostridia bacterium]|nr:hypothetical protein [Clostridia bacterium]